MRRLMFRAGEMFYAPRAKTPWVAFQMFKAAVLDQADAWFGPSEQADVVLGERWRVVTKEGHAPAVWELCEARGDLRTTHHALPPGGAEKFGR